MKSTAAMRTTVVLALALLLSSCWKRSFNAGEGSNVHGRGGWVSGGGEVITFRDEKGTRRAVLFDLVEFDPDFRDEVSATKPLSLHPTMLSELGYDLVRAEDLAEAARLIDRLQAWKPRAPEMVRQSAQALGRMAFRFTPLGFASPAHYTPTEGPAIPTQTAKAVPARFLAIHPDAAVQHAAYYGECAACGEFWGGTLLSSARWAELGARSRAGLVLHEGLRHLQIAQKSDFSDQNLRRMVALTLLGDPEKSPAPDEEMILYRTDGELKNLAGILADGVCKPFAPYWQVVKPYPLVLDKSCGSAFWHDLEISCRSKTLFWNSERSKLGAEVRLLGSRLDSCIMTDALEFIGDGRKPPDGLVRADFVRVWHDFSEAVRRYSYFGSCIEDARPIRRAIFDPGFIRIAEPYVVTEMKMARYLRGEESFAKEMRDALHELCVNNRRWIDGLLTSGELGRNGVESSPALLRQPPECRPSIWDGGLER